MKQNFIKLLSNIKLYSSYYFAIISVLGVIWGAFALYDNWRDDNKVLQKNVDIIIKSQIQAAKTDSLLLTHQRNIERQLTEIQGTTKSLENSYVKYLSKDKTLTKEDFLQYMEGLSFDIKKNSLSNHTNSELKIPFLIETQPKLMAIKPEPTP